MRFFAWGTLTLFLTILGVTLARYYDEDYHDNPRNHPLLPSFCGRNKESIEKRDLSYLVGSVETIVRDYPWMVLLKYRRLSKRHNIPRCAGSLISKRYVLTAAHCVSEDEYPPRVLTGVILGEYNTETDIDCTPYGMSGLECTDGAKSIGVEEVIIHELYRLQSHHLSNDIALLRLTADVTFNDFIKPVCLPWSGMLADRLTVAGWGKTDFREQSDILMELTVPFVKMDTCQAIYYTNPRPFKLGKGQLCAGGEWGKDVCSGDSGGPLMIPTISSDNSEAAWTVVGIVSFGKGDCGVHGVPSVYTYVYQYVDWIVKNIKA